MSIKEAFRTADLFAEGLGKGVDKLKDKIESRLKKAAAITLLMAIPSIILFSVGINKMDTWWIFGAAIWRAIFTIILLGYLSLEGVTFAFLMKGKGAIERYFKFIISITIMELCFAFTLMMIVAFTEDIDTQLIPPLILGLYILGALATLAFSPKHIAWTILILMLILAGAIFFPQLPKINFAETLKPPARTYAPPPVIPPSGRSGYDYRQVPGQQDYAQKEKGEIKPETEKTPAATNHSFPEENQSESQTPVRIEPAHDIAFAIANCTTENEWLAGGFRQMAKKDAIAASGQSNVSAKYLVRGYKEVHYGTDPDFKSQYSVLATVTFHVSIIEAKTGSEIKSFPVSKNNTNVTKETAERKATAMALADIFKTVNGTVN